MLGKKESKRRSNSLWYFGCESPEQRSDDQENASSDEEVVYIEQTPNVRPVLGPAAMPQACRRPHKQLLQNFDSSHAAETMTICSLTSVDTVPLGTDLDPENRYDNRWAAGKVHDVMEKLVVSGNLAWRVIDAENVGYSYAEEVLHRPKKYDAEGVRKAIAHFRSNGINVVVVTTRRQTQACEFPDAQHVIVADRTDDLMVLKEAYSRNCPIVSRDGYANWKKDIRVAVELRQWLEEASNLQVRYSWSPTGCFVPDFDLPRAHLKPVKTSAPCRNPSEAGFLHLNPMNLAALPSC